MTQPDKTLLDAPITMSTHQRIMKKLFDRTSGILLLVLASPIFLFAAILIKLCSRGPILFTQERIGHGGRPFRIFKFRTMHVRRPGDSDSTVTTRSDSRIFFGGGFLRKWKIDELPQLLNVVNGTMSLVGPRPTTANDYERMTNQQRQRWHVKPGITGLAQINGDAGISWPRRIEYDLAYIDDCSLWRDMCILGKTACLVLTGRANVTPEMDDEWSEPASPSTPRFAMWPFFDDQQIAAVTRVLESGQVNYWTGDKGRRFEEEFAAFTSCRHAIALANGTVALETALFALGIGPGDEVIVPSRTFIATASCVVNRGARPVFADVDHTTQGLCKETIESALTPRTKAIIVVHLGGWPCDMAPIVDFAERHGLAVIEDCAQAHGAEYGGRPVGSIGDIGTYSFCQDKNLSTGGEGGMLVTNNTDLWDRAWRYKDHGKTPDAFYQRQTPSTQFRWLHESAGTNLRMTEMQSAIGRVALQQLPGWVENRRENASRLNEACAEFACLRTPLPPDDVRPAYYRFYTFVRPQLLASGWSRDRILHELRENGIPCFSGSCSEIYLEEAIPHDWRPRKRLPVARDLGETSLAFLVHPTLTDNHMQRMVSAINQIMAQASESAAWSPAIRRAA